MNPPTRVTVKKGTSLPQNELLNLYVDAIKRRYASDWATRDPATRDNAAREMAKVLLAKHQGCQSIGSTNEILHFVATSKKFEEECKAVKELLDQLVVIRQVDVVSVPGVGATIKRWLGELWAPIERRLGTPEEAPTRTVAPAARG